MADNFNSARAVNAHRRPYSGFLQSASKGPGTTFHFNSAPALRCSDVERGTDGRSDRHFIEGRFHSLADILVRVVRRRA